MIYVRNVQTIATVHVMTMYDASLGIKAGTMVAPLHREGS
jgi:hypothetical protein